MAVALWAIINNRVALPREVVAQAAQTTIYKNLYEAQKLETEKVTTTNNDLIGDLRENHDLLAEQTKATQTANNLLMQMLQQKRIEAQP